MNDLDLALAALAPAQRLEPWAVCAAFGAAVGFVPAAAVGWASGRVPRAAPVVLVVTGVGALVGPVGLGKLVQVAGVDALPVWELVAGVAAVAWVGGLVVGWRRSRRTAPWAGFDGAVAALVAALAGPVLGLVGVWMWMAVSSTPGWAWAAGSTRTGFEQLAAERIAAGDVDGALPLLRGHAAANPLDPDARWGVAEALAGAGRCDEARHEAPPPFTGPLSMEPVVEARDLGACGRVDNAPTQVLGP